MKGSLLSKIFRPLPVTVFAVFAISLCSCAPRQKPAPIASPIAYEHVVRHNPENSVHLVKIDLSDPRVSVHVARGGPDPDGPGPWLTTLMPTSEIAQREKFDIAINGDFFTAKSTEDIEGKNTGYVAGKFAAPVGMAMSDGQVWHRSTNKRPFLEITSSGLAKFAESSPTDPIEVNITQMMGGSQMILRGGVSLAYSTRFALDRHPRTAVGTAQGGKKLILLVVDGRQPQLSVGMTLAELAHEMILAGCDSALNLDGGGSTTLVYRNPESKALEVVNSPSDFKERSVADALGVRVAAPMPPRK